MTAAIRTNGAARSLGCNVILLESRRRKSWMPRTGRRQTSGGAAALTARVAQDALGPPCALHDARTGAEPDRRAGRALLVPQLGDPGVELPALAGEPRVGCFGEALQQPRAPVGETV